MAIGFKTGGRKKGTPNKRSRLNVRDFLEAQETSPVEQILALVPQLEPRDQVRTWLLLQEYIEPKARVASHLGDDIENELADVPTEELMRIIKSQPPNVGAQ